MELDFDKEIDALLRKARRGTEATAVATDLAHLDADEIAAFAENALPEKTRQSYIMHFAECDRCRKILSQAIVINSEAAQIAAASAEIAAPAITSLTWRQRLFGMPTVAYTMGALVLLFSGFLGLAVWQNMNRSQNTEVSQIEQKETYSTAANAAAANTTSATNAASNAVNSAENTPGTIAPANPAIAGQAPSTMANAAANSPVSGPVGRTATAPNLEEQPKQLQERAETKPAAPMAAAPPAPKDSEDAKVTADQLAAKDDRDQALANEKQADSEMRAMKKEAPVTTMRQMNNLPLNGRKTAPMVNGASGYAPTRTVNGRTFTKKDGVWYDADYHGQSTINVRRGADIYKKLDGGLRSIADSLGGTVVTIWKGKAYRIQ